MERRSALKNLIIIGGGIALLPSCLNKPEKASVRLKNVEINHQQENILAEVAETIIPATDTPGAKALGVHLFVLKMLDDCYNKKDQKAFLTGLEQLETMAKKQYKNSFVDCSKDDKESVLKSIETGNQNAGEISKFYQIMKQKTIQGYLNSKYVMNNLIVFELVPGRYDGYFPVKNA